ncbi:ribonuclease 3-like protein 2 [Durio zibethinus]|uniref:Ribonuclease 3-like protein 2 n=1 Tax=Durio zibethinus TaxID=66656 RepID=A0A6P5WQW5_DURZI|nr:ribonuclease 3-like protein 2 [Durio zibethinus]
MNQFFPQVDSLTHRYTNHHAPPICYNHVITSSPSKMEVSVDLHPLPISYNHVTPTSSFFNIEASIAAVESILNYSFRNKRLLEEALTHSSYLDSASYQRLEFVGDAALGLALTNHVFLAYPKLDPGQLSLIRAANISTEKLARVAIKHRLFQFVRHNSIGLEHKVREFAEVVSQEDDPVSYGGSMKAPKILADIVESVAAAVYVDIDFDLTKLWVIFRGLLEPIITLEHLQQHPQPVTVLFEFCQKQGKHVDIKHWNNGLKNVASVFVDGEFVASGSSEQKEIAKLNAARGALHKLLTSMPVDVNAFGMDGITESFEIEGAKQKLHELCSKKKWPKPIYELEKDEGPPHEKKFISAVKIPTEDGIFYTTGDEKSRVKEAENSAASCMIRSLQESGYL